jgi:hypothetical protein
MLNLSGPVPITELIAKPGAIGSPQKRVAIVPGIVNARPVPFARERRDAAALHRHHASAPAVGVLGAVVERIVEADEVLGAARARDPAAGIADAGQDGLAPRGVSSGGGLGGEGF